ALDALRPRRLRLRQFAGGDAVGPVGEIAYGARSINFADVADHDLGRRADLQPVRPGRIGRVELAERLRDEPRRLVAELVARAAAERLDAGEPLALAPDLLRHAVPGGTGARKQALLRDLEHREPPLRRIVLGRRGFARRRHGAEVENA